MPYCRYPFQHSTYFTDTDHVCTSELPVSTFSSCLLRSLEYKNPCLLFTQPMDSKEDIVQQIFMCERQEVGPIPSIEVASFKPKSRSSNSHHFRKGLKKFMTTITVSSAFFFLLIFLHRLNNPSVELEKIVQYKY